jgi:hypothetical protein
MLETAEELESLQALLDASLARGGDHLRDIVTESRTPSAADVVALLTGIQHIVVATTTADGRPLTSAADGHFLHGRWCFTTSGTAVKARHLAARPDVSATHLRGDDFGVFTHGVAQRLRPGDDGFAELDEHLTSLYGASPSTWAEDIAYLRIEPRWMVAYAADPAALRATATTA